MFDYTVALEFRQITLLNRRLKSNHRRHENRRLGDELCVVFHLPTRMAVPDSSWATGGQRWTNYICLGCNAHTYLNPIGFEKKVLNVQT